MKGSLKTNEQSWAIEAKFKKEVGGGGVKWATWGKMGHPLY